MSVCREMRPILSLRVQGEAANVTKEIRVPTRAAWLVSACTTVEKIRAPRGAGMRGRHEGRQPAEPSDPTKEEVISRISPTYSKRRAKDPRGSLLENFDPRSLVSTNVLVLV